MKVLVRRSVFIQRLRSAHTPIINGQIVSDRKQPCTELAVLFVSINSFNNAHPSLLKYVFGHAVIAGHAKQVTKKPMLIERNERIEGVNVELPEPLNFIFDVQSQAPQNGPGKAHIRNVYGQGLEKDSN